MHACKFIPGISSLFSFLPPSPPTSARLFKLLSSLAPPQSNCLSIFLQFGNQLITLLNNVIVLLILVVGSVGFDNTLASDAVNGTWDAVCSDEFCQVANGGM